MIRVTVELFPAGSEEHKRRIGLIDIINNGTGSGKVGNYDVSFHGIGGEEFKLENFPRSKKNFWDLITAVLVEKVKGGE